MLPMLQFAMNNAPSAAGKYSPFQVLFGLSPMTPADLLVEEPELHHPAWDNNDIDLSAWIRRWWKARRRLRQFVRANLNRAADMVKRRYDRKHPVVDYQVGDLVMVSAKSHPPSEETRKLRPKFYGPYPIAAKVNDNAFSLSGLPPAVPKTQNISFLRLFVPSPPCFSSRPGGSHAEPIQVAGRPEWEVEAILEHRGDGASRRYLIQWVGTEDRTWLRASQLRHCRQLLNDYQAQHGLTQDQWSESSSSSSPESSSDSNQDSPSND